MYLSPSPSLSLSPHSSLHSSAVIVRPSSRPIVVSVNLYFQKFKIRKIRRQLSAVSSTDWPSKAVGTLSFASPVCDGAQSHARVLHTCLVKSVAAVNFRRTFSHRSLACGGTQHATTMYLEAPGTFGIRIRCDIPTPRSIPQGSRFAPGL